MPENDSFSFNISLSVLNHLGRDLYRSFVTVLGEAISNSWDADAENVNVYIDKKNNKFVIKDDGDGMTTDDFQNKFLKIGYSKRKQGARNSNKDRPFIGRKGIGKLALLSCAKKITVISKKEGGEYVGGTIDNASLDQAITDDLESGEYKLGVWQSSDFEQYTKDHTKGTIILFEGLDGGIRNTLTYLGKIVALYFRFSLIDSSFSIFINDKKITHKDIGEIGVKSQFLWVINDYSDPFIEECLTFLKETVELPSSMQISGFIASVNKPSDLKIRETDGKMTVDLFVNGRLREKDIIKNIPTNRLPESYIYGQIHFDELDDNADPFTSNREGVKTDNHAYQVLLQEIKGKILNKVIDQWDKLRRKHGGDGDSEHKGRTRKQRKSEELYNAVSSEFSLDKGDTNKTLIDGWVTDLRDDASYCFSSYAECYTAENLIRRYVTEKRIDLSPEAEKEVSKLRGKEAAAKSAGNISIDIRMKDSDLSYLSMSDLAALVDKKDRTTANSLHRDSYEYKPFRDSLMHTALLSGTAKGRLNLVYENIKGRLKQLLSGSS